MRIDSDTVFHFGKHEGKSFKWVLINDRGYLKWLLVKGFRFNRDCIWLLEEDFKIENEITFRITTKTDVLTFRKIEFVILPPKKFVRKKEQKIILSEDIIKIIDISKVPFVVEEKFVKHHHFDNKAIQNDDRFFTTTGVHKRKVYEGKILNEIINSNLKELK